MVAKHQRRVKLPLVERPCPLGQLWVNFRGEVTYRQVAAAAHGLHQPADDAVRIVLIADVMQNAQEQDCRRLAEVQRLGSLAEDLLRVAQVPVQVGDSTLWTGGQQRLRVQQHDRVVVHVHDPGFRGSRLRDLMNVLPGGKARADVEKLPDPRLGGKKSHDPPQECPLRQGLMGGELPQTTGREVAGVVDEVGEGVTDVAIGDRVFGFSADGEGAAELALLADYAPVPPSLGFAEAAGLPVVIETATRSLDALGVGAGSTLLVNGAAGGVGSAAVQLAVARGARAIGTARPANHDYLRSLGAEPVAYGEGLVERVRALAPDGVDAALDVAGSGVLPELIELAGGPEHVVTIADFGGAQEHGVTFSSGDAGRAVHALAEIGELIESGRFSLPVAQTFRLAEIAEAHRVSEDGHVRGKLVLLVG